MRFVLDPEGRVVADLRRKLPGRGVWITATREAVAEAVRKRVFTRGFRQSVSVDPDLGGAVEVLLRRAALQDLAMANKAGCVVAGFAKVEKALNGRNRVVLLHASDASADGQRKLDRIAAGRSGQTTRETAPVVCFTSAEVSAALGRTNVMHAAIADGGGAGQKFLWSVERLRTYVGTHPEAAPVADSPEQEQA